MQVYPPPGLHRRKNALGFMTLVSRETLARSTAECLAVKRFERRSRPKPLILKVKFYLPVLPILSARRRTIELVALYAIERSCFAGSVQILSPEGRTRIAQGIPGGKTENSPGWNPWEPSPPGPVRPVGPTETPGKSSKSLSICTHDHGSLITASKSFLSETLPASSLLSNIWR